jgi:hypothetical protein
MGSTKEKLLRPTYEPGIRHGETTSATTTCLMMTLEENPTGQRRDLGKEICHIRLD